CSKENCSVKAKANSLISAKIISDTLEKALSSQGEASQRSLTNESAQFNLAIYPQNWWTKLHHI
ncbi:hypothetical protein KA005_29175, partial [bacterium]|nr:hypothetical protein [bacterium]